MKGIKRSFLILSIFTICLMIFNKVYAVGIEITETQNTFENNGQFFPIENNMDEKEKKKVKFFFDISVKAYSNVAYAGDLGKWKLYPDPGNSDYYRTYGIMISTKPTTKYNENKNSGEGLLGTKEDLKSGPLHADNGSSYVSFNNYGDNLAGNTYKVYKLAKSGTDSNVPVKDSKGNYVQGYGKYVKLYDNEKGSYYNGFVGSRDFDPVDDSTGDSSKNLKIVSYVTSDTSNRSTVVRKIGISQDIIDDLKSSDFFGEKSNKVRNVLKRKWSWMLPFDLCVWMF